MSGSPKAGRVRIWLESLGLVLLVAAPFVIFQMLPSVATPPPPDPGLRQPEIAPPSPSPSPPAPAVTVAPAPASSVEVEVRNGSGRTGEATRVAGDLRAKGFRVARVGDANGPVRGLQIYFVDDPAKGAAVADAMGAPGTQQPLPANLTTTADVLLLLGSS